ncbi:hypothetical protein [Salinigranum sp.]|uniref:hypothetical protein n=1 Tax=Salinigranum sp. TaxID=1966351 RepID=UPI00356AFA22
MAEIETQRQMTRTEIAEVLREFATQLDPAYAGDLPVGDDEREAASDVKGTLVVGNRSATINPPETLEFDVEVASDSSLVGGDVAEHVSFGLRWKPEATEDDGEFEIK